MYSSILKLFHETVGRLISFQNNTSLRKYLQGFPDGQYFVYPKPTYISQFAITPKYSSKDFYGKINDEEASQRFGATIDEFSYWAWRACGIACVQMVLLTLNLIDSGTTLMSLIQEGLSLGGYDVKKDIGWYHDALATIAQRRGVSSKVEKFVPSSHIAKLIISGNYVLASMKSSTGGHLLLIYGVCIKNGRVTEFIINDPNNFNKLGKQLVISKVSFEKLFTRRIIVFEHKGMKSVFEIN
jgi:hypothetical protein